MAISNQYWKLFLIVILSCIMQAAVAYPLVGRWLTPDPKTNQPTSIVDVWANHGLLYGKIEKVFSNNGQMAVCTKCPGSLRNQPIQGLIILSGLQRVGPYKWSDGEILDFSKGRIYRCQIVVFDRGKRLRVRAYVGLPLFGHTQIWKRMKSRTTSNERTPM